MWKSDDVKSGVGKRFILFISIRVIQSSQLQFSVEVCYRGDAAVYLSEKQVFCFEVFIKICLENMLTLTA